MKLRDEKTFTDGEITAALSLILPEGEARREAFEINRLPDYKGFEAATSEELLEAPVRGPRSYDGDLLDLISLVSESCAQRAWLLLGVPPAEGRDRRRQFLQRMQPILRANPGTG